MSATFIGGLVVELTAGAAGASGARRMVITEQVNGATGALVDGPTRFAWDANTRTLPRTWPAGVKVRTTRYDYPGALEPTEQIFGANFKPFTLSGEWWDAYAGAGYADQALRAMESLLFRGGFVKIEFDGIVMYGQITDWDPDIIRTDKIEYHLSISPHYRAPGNGRAPVFAPTTKAPDDYSAHLTSSLSDMQDVMEFAPTLTGNGTLVADITTAINDLADDINALNGATADRFLGLSTQVQQPVNALARLSAAFVSVQQTGLFMLGTLKEQRSDLSLGYETAVGALTFDVWRCQLEASAREMIYQSTEASIEMARRAKPNALRLYSPRKGESLYDIALAVYGSADRWIDILLRNNLVTIELQGNETLILPE